MHEIPKYFMSTENQEQFPQSALTTDQGGDKSLGITTVFDLVQMAVPDKCKVVDWMDVDHSSGHGLRIRERNHDVSQRRRNRVSVDTYLHSEESGTLDPRNCARISKYR